MPPTLVVLTDWLSKMAALGCSWRPTCRRSRSRSVAFSTSQVPPKRPASKPPVDRRPGRVVVRQEAPLAARSNDVEDGVQDLAQLVGPRSTTRARGRQHRLDRNELSFRQI